MDIQELTSKHPTNVGLGAKQNKPNWCQISLTTCTYVVETCRNTYLQIMR